MFYARAVEPIILPALNNITAEQSAPTIKIDKAVSKLLDLCSTYPNTCICYSASDMVLHIDSDASYLSLPLARSRTAGDYSSATRPPVLLFHHLNHPNTTVRFTHYVNGYAMFLLPQLKLN